MSLADLQPEAMAALDAAYARATEIVDPYFLYLAESRIEQMLGGSDSPGALVTTQDLELSELVDQMLIDVAGLDDKTAKRAGRYFEGGGMTDFVTASYIIEARTRLRIMSERLLGSDS
jgi:hypothetical protein